MHTPMSQTGRGYLAAHYRPPADPAAPVPSMVEARLELAECDRVVDQITAQLERAPLDADLRWVRAAKRVRTLAEQRRNYLTDYLNAIMQAAATPRETTDRTRPDTVTAIVQCAIAYIEAYDIEDEDAEDRWHDALYKAVKTHERTA